MYTHVCVYSHTYTHRSHGQGLGAVSASTAMSARITQILTLNSILH